MAVRILDGISEIIDSFDAVLVDLWGCVHNGLAPYPGAIDCLHRIRAAERQVLFLSNAPRPRWSVAERLESIGVPDHSYDAIVSSGDVTIRALNRRDDPWHANLGSRYYHLGPDRSAAMIDAIEGEAVPFDAADYILNTGLIDDETETVDDYRDTLNQALTRAVPMVCANPDRLVMRGDSTILCAGALAEAYEAMGGPVRYHGKPYASAYDMAFETLRHPGRDRVLMIGDSFSTDIAGAVDYGIASVWIAGGIHADEVGYLPGRPLDAARVAKLVAAAPAQPTAVAAGLVW